MARSALPAVLIASFSVSLFSALFTSVQAKTRPEQRAIKSLQGSWSGQWQLLDAQGNIEKQAIISITMTLEDANAWLTEKIRTEGEVFTRRNELSVPYRTIKYHQDTTLSHDKNLLRYVYISDQVWGLQFEFLSQYEQRAVKVRETWRRQVHRFVRSQSISYLSDKKKKWHPLLSLVLRPEQ